MHKKNLWGKYEDETRGAFKFFYGNYAPTIKLAPI